MNTIKETRLGATLTCTVHGYRWKCARLVTRVLKRSIGVMVVLVTVVYNAGIPIMFHLDGREVGVWMGRRRITCYD